MFKKVLLLVGVLNFVDASIVSLNEDAVLNSFSTYRDQVRKLKGLAAKFTKKKQEFNALAKKEGERLQKMQEELKKKGKTDLASSAMGVKKFEQVRNEVQMKIGAKEKELMQLQKEGANADKEMSNIVNGLKVKIEKAMDNMIKKSGNKIKVIFGWPSGRLIYIDPALDTTKNILSELKSE